MAEAQIWCPKCRWRPNGDSRWYCTPRMGGCGHVWNTFLTGGLCPKCGCEWEITACLACRQFSLHKEWYHYPDDDAAEPSERALEHAAGT